MATNVDLHRKENETEEMYIWRIGQAKTSGLLDMSWEDLADLFNAEFREDDIEYTSSAYRKPFQQAQRYFDNCFKYMIKKSSDSESPSKIEKKIEELRKERIKIQTANVERNRIDRSEARQEMYYEQIGSVCKALPLPKFKNIDACQLWNDEKMQYLCAITDIHYGAKFKSENNEYSPEIAKERFEYLCYELIKFVHKHKIHTLHIVNLGDTIQNILRMSDLKLNDTTVVKSVVEVSRLIAQFLNQLSSVVNIKYYHVGKSNHSQYRVLGAKASEISDEDIEYVIANYIKDLCRNNERVNIVYYEDKDYTFLDIDGFDVVGMHGHQVKNVDDSIKDLSMLLGSTIVDYLLLGHFHSGKQITSGENSTYDVEVLQCPSFIGSCPYSDRLMKGSKAAVNIFGFNQIYGHTETYKIILN